MRGVFLDAGSINPAEVDLSRWRDLVEDWVWHDTTAAQEVTSRIAQADVVVTNKVVLTAAHLAAAANLRLICIAATGTNNVDLDAARARNIAVCNVRGYATASVVQHVFMLMLALRGHLVDYREAVRDGAWSRSPHFSLLKFPLRELAGATLGIVGYGELGRGVAALAHAFGMHIRVAALPDRPNRDAELERVPLDELLPQVDVLSLHCPLTAETRDLINARTLQRMRKDAILINTARGGIVNETALAEALRAAQLGGAGIDVLTQEPPPPDHPLLSPDIPNLIVTPHIAWACRESRQRLADAIASNLRSFLAGRPTNLVV